MASLTFLQACVKRIQGDESGHKHCTGQYFDYWSCVDKCVSICFSIMWRMISFYIVLHLLLNSQFYNAGGTKDILKTEVMGEMILQHLNLHFYFQIVITASEHLICSVN